MQMPRTYNETQVDYTPIQPGGHKCQIQKVEEAVSKKQNQMLVVYYDFDNADTQPLYLSKQFQNDKKAKGDQAKWKGVYYITTSGEYGVTNLKRFVTAVERSNPGFVAQWDLTPGDGRFVNSMRGKKIGMVYRAEEYRKSDGNIGRSVKPFRPCNYTEAFDQKVPDVKKLKEENDGYMTGDFGGVPSSDPQMAMEGFMNIPPDALNDPNLPFN